jgi:acetyl esterase/lipase
MTEARGRTRVRRRLAVCTALLAVAVATFSAGLTGPVPSATAASAAGAPTAGSAGEPVAQRVVGAPVRVTRGITYLTSRCPGRGLEAETADLYSPLSAGEERSPLVVLVHGGSFVKGSGEVDNFPRVATELAALGWSAVSIDYCLPPIGTPGYPTEVGNVRSAISYFVDRAGEYRIDPRRVAVWGASAGASLAIDSTTLMDRGRQHPILAAVGWSGAYDLGSTSGIAVPISQIVDNYLGCRAAEGQCRDTAAQASAVRHVRRGSTPPMFLANSTDELMPLDQLTAMRHALTDAGVRVVTSIIPGSRHAMAYTNAAFCPSVSFLEQYLGRVDGRCATPWPVEITSAGVRRLPRDGTSTPVRDAVSRVSGVPGRA